MVFNRNNFNSLVIDFLTGYTKPESLGHLQDLIENDNKLRNQFNAIRNAWIVSGKLKSSDLDQGWQNILSIISKGSQSEKNVIRRKSRSIKFLYIAASWLIFLVAGSVITKLLDLESHERISGTVEMSVPLGARSHVKMPDGTDIWINAGSTLSYDANYGEATRTVRLKGEAFFDVARDKLHPFIVHTSALDVHAVGTRFNVKAYSDEKTVAATLEEGKIEVRILDTGDDKNIILKENEKIVILKRIRKEELYTENADEKVFENIQHTRHDLSQKQLVSILSHVNTQLVTSWKDDRWIIQGQELGLLAPMLERRFNIRIIFGNDEIKKFKFTGIIESETVDQIMKLLTMTAPVEYSITKDMITLNLDKKKILDYGITITQ